MRTTLIVLMLAAGLVALAGGASALPFQPHAATHGAVEDLLELLDPCDVHGGDDCEICVPTRIVCIG